MERLLIPWSGGLDSTLLVVRALEHSKAELHTSYVDLENNSTKSWCEERSIIELRTELRKVYKDFTHHDDTKINLGEWNSHGASCQPFLWLLSMIPVASTLVGCDVTLRIQIGYIFPDETIEDLPKIDEAWKAMWNQTIPDYYAPDLETPLKFMKKRDIHRTLTRYGKHHGIDLVKHTWTCEDPKRIHNNEFSGYKRCGVCSSCKNEILLDEPNQSR